MTQFIHISALFFSLFAISGCFHKDTDAQQWQLSSEGVTSLSLSRDGRFALASSNETGIVLWDLFTNQTLGEFGYQDPEKSTVIASKLSDNHQFAITATSQNFAVWDLAWSQAKGLWSIADGYILGVDVSQDGEQVLLGLSNNKAIYIDLKSGRRLEFLAHQETVNSVALSPNGRYALSGGNDRFGYFWDTQSGQIIHQFPAPQRITRVALSRNASFAFVADAHASASIWNLKTGERKTNLQITQRHANFSAARFSSDDQFLVTGTPSGDVAMWALETGEQVERWQAKKDENARPPSAVIYDVSFDATQRVISGASSGYVQAWIPHQLR